MPRRAQDPLRLASRLLVDGTNVLHALGRSAPLPPAAVVGRLRAVVPAPVSLVVVLDGSPAPSARDRHLVAGVEVRYAGRRPADALLRDLVAAGPSGAAVVTDDGALATELRALGAVVLPTSWLAGVLDRQRLGAPAAGRPRPISGPPPPDRDADPERPAWRPGRGATVKRGNPRRRGRSDMGRH
ncbi:MAG: hypothetical protein MUC54_00470 [Chloroflexi bacterium]|nr:hypothetical protein [Chloroflexota bacterium]